LTPTKEILCIQGEKIEKFVIFKENFPNPNPNPKPKMGPGQKILTQTYNYLSGR